MDAIFRDAINRVSTCVYTLRFYDVIKLFSISLSYEIFILLRKKVKAFEFCGKCSNYSS